MAISETVELLGKGLYDSIPDTLTLSAIPTSAELDIVGKEDFDRTMLDTIFPKAIEENIDFYKLLEIDYQWICRCLRILNYGPFYTTNSIFCSKCGVTYGEYQVNLETVECKALPSDFNNDVVITKDEFLDFDKDIHFHLPTIQDILNSHKDKAFQDSEGNENRNLSRLCYMITAIGNKNQLTPVEIKMMIENQMTSADYIMLKGRIQELADYGLRAGGTTQCPKCGNPDGGFLVFLDDKFFRPTMGDLRKWKDYRSSGQD